MEMCKGEEIMYFATKFQYKITIGRQWKKKKTKKLTQ